jgi:hypothetical protein
MRHRDEDLPPSSLRGRLCEVFFSALSTEMIEQLMRRLGDKATLDDPVFGPTAGADGTNTEEALQKRLHEWVGLLNEYDVRYERTTTVVGADRDVTEGVFELRADGHHRMVPVAVLMERKREREVALRIFFGASALGTKAAKGPKPTGQTVVVPTFVQDLLSAVAKKDVAGVSAALEEDGSLRDATGVEHARDAIARILGGREMVVQGVADDGRTCAVEAVLGGNLVLLVLQRGDSGLVRSLRIYSEL